MLYKYLTEGIRDVTRDELPKPNCILMIQRTQQVGESTLSEPPEIIYFEKLSDEEVEQYHLIYAGIL